MIGAVAFALLFLFSVQCIATGSLAPVSFETDVLKFAALGDWGGSRGNVTEQQLAVAAQLGISAAKANISFLVALGDNFYEDGVASDTDPQWDVTYSNVYTAASLQSIPWYAFLGNHDHHFGRGQGQLDYYYNRRDSRWVMPDYWYKQSFRGAGFSVDLVLIDTVVLAPRETLELRRELVAEGAPARLLANLEADLDWYLAQSTNQWDWLNATLAASTADWLLVAGHYPVFSAGEHGNTPTLVSLLKPMLELHNVDAYFCGHDHSLQHLTENGVHYILSGAGGRNNGKFNKIHQTVWGKVVPGFTLHEVSRDKFTSMFVDANGAVQYEFSQMRKRNL